MDKPALSKEKHLKALYCILRAEGIESLRWAVRKYLAKQAKTIARRQVRDDEHACIYTNVSLENGRLSILSSRCILTIYSPS